MPATEVPVKGVLKIDISQDEMEATLTFERSDEGDEWTAQNVLNALGQRGVTEPSREVVQKILREAQLKQEPLREIVARGRQVVPNEPERVEWAYEEIPDDIRDAAEQVCGEAERPEIYRIVKEKVEVEKEAPKKGKLGFLQNRPETQTVTEERTRKERVFIEPTVRDRGYAKAEEAIGSVQPKKIGVPGLTVTGREVPPKAISDPNFYAGDNIERRGNQLVAIETGLVRVGLNWVDLVPFARHEWEVTLSQDKATSLLTIRPGSPQAPAPAAEEIMAAAEEAGYPRESLMPAGEIDRLIKDAVRTGNVLEAAPLSLSRDAAFDIDVTEDKLAAHLNLHKGKGRGKRLDLKEVGAAIKKSGLKNLDFDKIRSDITDFYQSEEFDLTGYLLCEGKAPTVGPERQVDIPIRFHSDNERNAIVDRLKTNPPDAEEMPSIEEFPPGSIQKTSPVEAEQLIMSVDPPTTGAEGYDVYGIRRPGLPGPGPDIKCFEHVQYREKDHIVVTEIAGVLDFAVIDGTYFLRVRAHVDAEVAVGVSEDRMQARLSLKDGLGSGKRITRELVDQEIARAKVVHGVDTTVVDKLIRAAQAGTEVKAVPFAKGTEPVNQSDFRMDWHVRVEGGKPVTIRKDGRADFRTQDSIVSVTKGELLCTIHPGQEEPKNGTDVFGRQIQARTISQPDIEIGDNIEKEEQKDGTILLRSAVDGELIYAQKRVDVQTIHTLKGDVDMTVGNIKFPGTVVIQGIVRSGFYVVATGDIKIAGGVEAALLSSDGDIVIKTGVKGAGKAVLRSRQRIMSSFVELATLLAVGDIILKTACVRSKVKSNGKMSFQDERGRVVGGAVAVRHGLEAGSVGSPNGVTTKISFGQDYLIADMIEKEEKEIEKLKKRISQTDVEMRNSERAGDSETLARLRQEKVVLLKMLEKRGLRLFTLRERFEEHYPSEITIRGTVHAGTVFESHGRVYEITHDRNGLNVAFNPTTGNIEINELSQT